MQKRVVPILLGVMTFLALLVLYGYLIERFRLQISHVEIKTPKCDTQEGIVVVQLSDLHLKEMSSYEEKVISRVNNINPDVIVITGDLFYHYKVWEDTEGESFKTMLSAIEQFVTSLQAKHGIYVCRGNNDISNDKEVSDLFLHRMQNIGVRVLSNQITTLRTDRETISLLGVDFPEFTREEVADFWVNSIEDGKCLQANSSEKNSYSHFLRFGQSWQNYTFSGRFRQTDPQHAGIGFTFYSAMDRGYDHFYRIRRSAGSEPFVVSPHNTTVTGDNRYLDTPIKEDIWYRFRIQCQTESGRTVIRARIWQDGATEPNYWQAHVTDASSSRLTRGTVGLWSAGQGIQQFDDLLVETHNGQQLLAEGFENYQRGEDPAGWIDFNYEAQAIPSLIRHQNSSHYSILLAHAPQAVNYAAPAGVNLQLCGHTHGGQICFPLIGPVFYRDKKENPHVSGLYRVGETILYVNKGIGTALIPVRLFCPPEITVLHIHRP